MFTRTTLFLAILVAVTTTAFASGNLSDGTRPVASVAETFAIKDADQSGVLDIAEFSKGFPEKKLESVKKHFKICDTDADGKVDFEEFLAPVKTRAQKKEEARVARELERKKNPKAYGSRWYNPFTWWN
jgi:Ca2+-binding EF-hand superfamily protein